MTLEDQIFRFKEYEKVDYKGTVYIVVSRVTVDYDKKYLIQNRQGEQLYVNESDIEKI